MFILGKEKGKDDYDRLIQSGKSYREAREYLAAKERARRDDAVAAEMSVAAAVFDTSSAGVVKAAKFNSTFGVAFGMTATKMLSATKLSRMPEEKQPIALLNRPMTDTDLLNERLQHALTSGILDLKSCNLTTVPGRAMSTLLLQWGNVRSINLNNNRLTTVPAGMVPYCARITDLSVANNRLREIPRSILLLPHVETLDLSQNHISKLEVIKAPKLTILRMSHNHVSEIDNMSFLGNLRLLHLDHCHLTQLSSHIKKLKNLTKLDVSYNTIISLALPSRDATKYVGVRAVQCVEP